MEELRLCKPCAEKMRGMRAVSEVKEVRKIGGNQKIDCEQCGRRRYGYLCEVEFKPLKERII